MLGSRCSFLWIPFLALAARCTALFILDTIANNPSLTTLQSYVTQLSALSAQLGQADNYTFFAPTDTAFQKWLASANPAPTLDDIEATLLYCLVHGIYPVATFTSSPQFVPSFQVNTTFTNVTTGQVLDIALRNNSTPQITSGLRTNSSITSNDIVVTGGLMQIIDTVPMLPPREPIVAQQSNLSYFIELVTEGGFLDADRDAFTTEMEYLPDVTYFAPNSAAAVANFPSSNNLTYELLTNLFEYHIVTGFIGYSTRLTNGLTLQTVEGANLTIRIAKDGSKWVNGAKIIASDYLVANGVLHTIDQYLDPDNITAPKWVSSSMNLPPGAIAGIIVGCILLLALSATFGFLFIRRVRPGCEDKSRMRNTSVEVQSNSTHSPIWRSRSLRSIFPQLFRTQSRNNDQTYNNSPVSELGYRRRDFSTTDTRRWDVAELEAVKSRVELMQQHVHELEAPVPSRKQQEEWERYPAERYQNRRS